jgi:pimeloyl-ACP methyl ester carboxylesterase
VTGEEIMYRQAELIGAASGSPLLARVLNRSLQQQLFEAVKSTDSPEALEEKVRSTLKLSKSAGGENDQQKNAAQAAMEGQLQMIKTPWFRFFLTYDPRPELEKLRVPVLVLNGEKDLQVDPKQNLPVMEAALKAGGNQHARVRQMPGLNHLFQRCDTGNPGEYGTIEETINEAALKEISEWIAALATR